MNASVYKTFIFESIPRGNKKNFSVDKLYKDLCDYMHLLFEAMTSFARIYVFSLPYFAINININFVSALALSLFLGS